jgi:hypothetical protein
MKTVKMVKNRPEGDPRPSTADVSTGMVETWMSWGWSVKEKSNRKPKAK